MAENEGSNFAPAMEHALEESGGVTLSKLLFKVEALLFLIGTFIPRVTKQCLHVVALFPRFLSAKALRRKV